MVLIRDKCAFANYCVSTKLDFNACKFFNLLKHDNQNGVQACNNEKLKISRLSSLIARYLISTKIESFQYSIIYYNAVPEDISNKGEFILFIYTYTRSLGRYLVGSYLGRGVLLDSST